MKRILYTVFFLCILQSAFGQQEPQYSQYMFNQLAYNPAYAGSRNVLSANVLFRKQWWGFPGAPTTGNISIHGPVFNERHGVGVNFIHDRLGVLYQNFLEASYAYRIPVLKGSLAFGLHGGFTNYTNRFSEVTTRDPDQIIPNADLTAWLPRVGTGIYYNSEKFYLGASVPNFITGRYFRYNNSIVQQIADEQRAHYFLMAGAILPLGENVDFRPSTVVKLVGNAPSTFDINGTFFFSKVFGVGAGYRWDDGLIFMLEYFSPKYFRFGYAFDYSLKEVQSVSAGSHEFMVGLDLNWGRSRFLTPRYF